jgi:hypothetical protein
MAYTLTDQDKQLANRMAEQRLAVDRQNVVAKPKDNGNWFTNSLSTVGGILGGIGGSFFGPGIGTAAGGAAGAGAGKWLENLFEGNKDLGDGVLGEAAFGTLGGIGKGLSAIKGAGGALKAGKGLGTAAQVLRAGVPKVATGTSTGILSGFGGRMKEGLQDRATTNLLKLTPSQTQKMLDSGINPTDLAKRAAAFGGSPADIIGKTGKGGPLQATIRSLEEGIKTTASQGGKNIKIDATDIIKNLKNEAKVIKKELGGGARLNQINKVIADAESKYKGGVTINKALETLRTANAQFGKSILDDTGDAVVKAAQKLEANTLRSALKERFPSIAKGLDDQSGLIQLREVMQRARAIDKTGGFKTGAIDLTRPGTFVDPLLNAKSTSRAILGGGSGLKMPTAFSALNSPMGKIASTQLGARALTGNLPGQEQPTPEMTGLEQPQIDPMTGMPAVESSMGGMDGSSVLGGASPAQSIYTREAVAQDIQRDLQATGGANMDKYITLFNFLNPEGSQGKPNATTQKSLSQSANADATLQQLESILAQAGGSGGPIGGNISSFFGSLGLNNEAKTYNDLASGSVTQIAKALGETGAMSDADRVAYANLIPRITDTPAVASAKFAALRQRMETAKGNTLQYGAGDGVAEALAAAGY